MHYFFSEIEVDGNTACITDAEQIHHMRDVLRLKPGERITICSAGSEYLCTLSGWEKTKAILAVESRKTAPEAKARLAIGCAIPKNVRMDDIIDKLTQLGVDVIMPLQTERVVGRGGERTDARLERWKKISRSAAEQSQRRSLPTVTPVLGLGEVLEQAREYELKLIPTLEGERKTLTELTAGSPPARVIALIGPEGDFTPAEVQQARQAGFRPVSLGETVLRVDTAAIAVASYLKLGILNRERGEGL